MFLERRGSSVAHWHATGVNGDVFHPMIRGDKWYRWYHEGHRESSGRIYEGSRKRTSQGKGPCQELEIDTHETNMNMIISRVLESRKGDWARSRLSSRSRRFMNKATVGTLADIGPRFTRWAPFQVSWSPCCTFCSSCPWHFVLLTTFRLPLHSRTYVKRIQCAHPDTCNRLYRAYVIPP